MLELIVLGQIPGTNIQITFAWIVLVVLGSILYFDFKTHHKISKSSSQNKNTKNNTAKA